MYYELYVDVLFLVNFMMDYIVLLLVRRMLQCTATHANICFGAFLGSFLTCAIVIFPIPYAVVKQILFHAVVNTCMIRVGLKITNIRAFVKAMIMLYIGSFLLGGILEVFRPYVRVGSLFLVLAIAGYYMILGIWKFLGYIQRWNQSHCCIDLYWKDKKYQIKGMIDTGNHLRDPLSGQPVSILNKMTAKELFGESVPEDIRYIPFRAIGTQEGVMPAFHIDKMCIFKDTECWIEQPLLAISEETISEGGEYEMILNPNLF